MQTTYKTTIYLSKKGIKELSKQIKKLEQRLKLNLKELRELDRNDNHDGRLDRVERLAALETIEYELTDKRALLMNVKQLPRKRDALRVALGSVVELIDQQGRMFKYTLVDSFEANPSDGRISILSPLGQNLIGKKVKQTVEWSAKFNSRQLHLVRIS